MKFEKQTFTNQEVCLDDNEFVECQFNNCTMIYGGGSGPKLVGCSFNNIRWSFADAALNTLHFMTGLYHGAGEGGRQLIEQTFENIKRGKHPGPKNN